MVFYGLFSLAEYVSISGRFAAVKRMSYIETYIKKKMTVPERLLLRKIGFGDEEYLTGLAKGDKNEYDNVSCCIIADGEVVLSSNGRVWRLTKGEKFARAGVLYSITVEAVTDSKILLICEDDFENLPEHSPKLWRVLHNAIKWTETNGIRE
jgi:CRP-like cAMP-binding protein